MCAPSPHMLPCPHLPSQKPSHTSCSPSHQSSWNSTPSHPPWRWNSRIWDIPNRQPLHISPRHDVVEQLLPAVVHVVVPAVEELLLDSVGERGLHQQYQVVELDLLVRHGGVREDVRGGEPAVDAEDAGRQGDDLDPLVRAALSPEDGDLQEMHRGRERGYPVALILWGLSCLCMLEVCSGNLMAAVGLELLWAGKPCDSGGSGVRRRRGTLGGLGLRVMKVLELLAMSQGARPPR